MGPDTVDEDDVGRIPPKDGPQADGTATVEGLGRRLDLPPDGGCNGGGRVGGGGDLRHPPLEHSSTMYCD